MSLKEQRIEEIITGEVNQNQIAGANVLVVKEDKVLYQNSFGYADKEKKQKMQENTIFRMYSMSKPITAAAAMILFERGIIDLYEPVSKYLEGYKNQRVWTTEGEVFAKREMTIRDLLNMTSGLSYPNGDTKVGIMTDKLFKEIIAEREAGRPMATVDLMSRAGELPLTFHPGEKWLYGTSADVMGAVIEVASGKRFGQFLSDEIFTPLGMEDTAFYVPAEKQDRFAQLYRYSKEKRKLSPEYNMPFGLEGYLSPPAFESGGAGLVSTIPDYRRFAEMLLNGGAYNGVSILSRKTVDFMRRNQLTEEQMKEIDWPSMRGYGYGNFMRVLLNPALSGSNASIGEYGWDGWTGNYYIIDPSEGFLFMYFIQRCDTGMTDITRKLRAVAYSMIE